MADDDTDYARGPGRRYGHGPIPEAYAETNALESGCPNCGAAPGDFCTHPGGVQRRIPCPKRMPHQPDTRGDE